MNGMIATSLKRLSFAMSLVVGLVGSVVTVQAQDKVAFATNWKAQGSHGGFYQAVADGTYKKFGLDVEIVQGGPQINTRALLSAAKVDFLLSVPQNVLENYRANIPTVMVAALLQKDPIAVMAHPGKFKDIADMRRAQTIYVARPAQFSWWPWAKRAFDLSDDQVKAYNYTMAPFLANPESVQQAYATSEPLYIDAFKPDVFLLADYGWSAYSSVIETRTELVNDNPDLVSRFIDATMIGYSNFLYGDRTPAYDLIRKDNPEMTVEKLDAEVNEILRLGLIDGGDAVERGIGAVDLKRFSKFYDDMVEVGLYKPGEIDLAKVVTDKFVNKAVGVDIRKRAQGN